MCSISLNDQIEVRVTRCIVQRDQRKETGNIANATSDAPQLVAKSEEGVELSGGSRCSCKCVAPTEHAPSLEITA